MHQPTNTGLDPRDLSHPPKVHTGREGNLVPAIPVKARLELGISLAMPADTHTLGNCAKGGAAIALAANYNAACEK